MFTFRILILAFTQCAAATIVQKYSCLSNPVPPTSPDCHDGLWDIEQQWPAQSLEISGSYPCYAEFNWIVWACRDDTTVTIKQLAVKLAEPPRFNTPLPSTAVSRTTTESLDPKDDEKPTATSPCGQEMRMDMEDGPLEQAVCGEWNFARTWTWRLVDSPGRTWCTVPTGGDWDRNTFEQTVHLVDTSPPANFAEDVEPGFQSAPSIGPALPAKFRCDEPINPRPPRFFVDPVCAEHTIVQQVGQPQLIDASGFSTHVCGSLHYEYTWRAQHFDPCSGTTPNAVQQVTILPAPPKFSFIPAPATITTSESLSPDHLGHAIGISPCGHKVDVTFVDEPPVRVACGKWTISRVWTVALHFDEVGCSYPKKYTASATQLITITDDSAPKWVHLPPEEVHIPFFTNYQTPNSIPIAEEMAHEDMLALGLVSYPTRLLSQDGPVVLSTPTSPGGCPANLGSMRRRWAVSDACGNARSMEQTLIFENPPGVQQPVQQWDPAARLFVFAPGIEQLDDGCYPGKRVFQNDRRYDPMDNITDADELCGEEGWWSPLGCREIGGNDHEDFYIQDIHSPPPYFPDDTFPSSVTMDTTASLDPDVNPALGKPAGASYCSTPFTISYHDAPPEQQGCGVWSIARTWKIQPHYADCGGAEAIYPDALTQRRVQVITIHDVTAPEWVHVPPPEVQVPFFENYQASNPIPLAKEIAHADMLARGLVSHPVKVSHFDDSWDIPEAAADASCDLGLASFTRTWTVSDVCGNSQSYVQHIILLHPPSNPAPTQPWRPADADLATADRDITGPNRLFAYAPGVEQLGDACYPGKKVVGSGAVFTGVWQTDHNCSAGQWTETACRLEEQEGAASGVAVHSWPPYFASFPADITIFTDQSLLDLEVPTGGSHCGTPFIMTHHDAPPVQQSCGMWTIQRTWTIAPDYPDCGATGPSLDALTVRRVQVITVQDPFPPEFITTPTEDLYVEFMEDYGPSATGIPQVEDIASDPDMATLGLRSYPITVNYTDIGAHFYTGAVSHAQGMAVVSRLWTTRDACGNTADWLQTIRVRNPNSNGGVGPLGSVGNFTVFGTQQVLLQFTEFHGSVGSNSKIFLQNTVPSAVSSNLPVNHNNTVIGFSEKLLTFSDRLFAKRPNPCSGPTAIICDAPEQYTCKVVQQSSPITTAVRFDENDNLYLEGNGLVYNIFNDLDVNRWRYAPTKVAPVPSPKQYIRAEGFVILNMQYSSLDATRTLLRETVFQQTYDAGMQFLLYNLKNVPEVPIQNMAFMNTTLVGSIISQDAWNAMVFNEARVMGQIFAMNKEISVRYSTFIDKLFVPNFQIGSARSTNGLLAGQGTELAPTSDDMMLADQDLHARRTALGDEEDSLPQQPSMSTASKPVAWAVLAVGSPLAVLLLLVGALVYVCRYGSASGPQQQTSISSTELIPSDMHGPLLPDQHARNNIMQASVHSSAWTTGHPIGTRPIVSP